ncbi:MAG TPA: carbohydrate ABC transporter permease [Micromonosporaceae bacterium]|nr:carbohydrate ABC transporter permease [Micromonosporaceae bacterium]
MAVDSLATRTVATSDDTSRTRPLRAVGRRRRRTTWVWNTIAVVLAIVLFFPVYWMIVTAFRPASQILTFHPNLIPLHATFSNFDSAIHAPNFLDDLRNSLIITGVTVVGGIFVGFLGALALARFVFAGRRAVILILLGVQMVPAVAIIIPIYLQLQTWHQTNQLSGVILSYIVLLLPFTTWMLRGFIANVPRELDEAALVDGCSRWQTFTKILLPLTLPGLVAAAIYGFIQSWNEFFLINILNNSPDKQNLMVWLVSNQTAHGTFWGPLMAGATLSSVPVVIFFLIIQKNVTMGLTAGAVKG